MPQYKVNAPLGVYITGLGSREDGGVFDVTDDKAARLHLDECAALERLDAKPKPKNKVDKPAMPDDTKEG